MVKHIILGVVPWKEISKIVGSKVSVSRLCFTSFRQKRFYVKELSWCKPRDERRHRLPQLAAVDIGSQQSKQFRSQQKFGVIAAVSQNYVIGVNGKIPWHLPEDTSYFRDVTRGKVVITGRVSFEETCDQSHLSHARWTVLISRIRGEENLGGKIKVCRSFDEAIDIANDLAIADGRDCSEDIDCWIVGGERVFEEAFRHPALHELRLTRIKVNVDDHQQGPVAKFPATYRWDYRFKEINKWEGTESGTTVQGDLRYSFHVYQCFRPR